MKRNEKVKEERMSGRREVSRPERPGNLRDEGRRVREEEASGVEEFESAQPPPNPEPTEAFLAWPVLEELFVRLQSLHG